MSIIVVGAGIAGLAAALDLADRGFDVEVLDADDRVGGKLRSSPFVGLATIDEGADAYLMRSPAAVAFAQRVGVHEVVHPNRVGAAVWHDGLHPLPEGVMMGVPTGWRSLATTGLLSWRGKLRAAADLVLPRTDTDGDRLGVLTWARLGDEVHERLIDTLIGSIYATDIDHASLVASPQVEQLANHRSLILGARRGRARRSSGPIFAAPANGMEVLAGAARATLEALGVTFRLGSSVRLIEPGADGPRVDDQRVDAVIIATPPAAAAAMLGANNPAHDPLASIESADIAMVRLAIPTADWPERLTGLSGYLVPKPDQRLVTAASFGSQKWAHCNPPGHHILRVSLGRDGLAVLHHDDDHLLARAADEVGRHLDIDIAPTATSVTRWTAAFPQYRPGHRATVDAIEGALVDRIEVAGAAYHGIGVPSCIASGQRAAERVAATVRA